MEIRYLLQEDLRTTLKDAAEAETRFARIFAEVAILTWSLSV
jgi:hypothetical protein